MDFNLTSEPGITANCQKNNGFTQPLPTTVTLDDGDHVRVWISDLNNPDNGKDSSLQIKCNKGIPKKIHLNFTKEKKWKLKIPKSKEEKGHCCEETENDPPVNVEIGNPK